MLLGIDLGTASLKVALYDQAGTLHYKDRESYQVITRQPNWAEIDPLVWFRALQQVLRRCPQLLKQQIISLSFSGQMHGCIATGKAAEPLYPALLWLDQRAQHTLSTFPDDLLQQHGNLPYTGAMGASILWLQQHEPHVVAQTFKFLNPKDWLRAYLTGLFHTEPSDASGTLLTTLDGKWHESILNDCQIQLYQLPEIVDSSTAIGHLKPDIAKMLDLPIQTTVVVGGGDTACALIGAGFVNEQPETLLTIGTGAQLVMTSAIQPDPVPMLNLFHLPRHHLTNRWYQMAAMLNGGSVLEWMRSQWQLDWETIYLEAFPEGLADRKTTVKALPWLNGERTPWMSNRLSAGWCEVKSHHQRGDLFYAMLRSVALSIKMGWETLSNASPAPTQSIVFAGGGSLNPLWRQLIANALNIPIQCLAESDLSVKGAALLAGLGIGHIHPHQIQSFRPSVSTIITPEANAQDTLLYHQHYLQEYAHANR